ncbi:uncharacterized protein METZ01_LOCUS107346 [marine metagenome]|uniref:Uncharacterized protein n=1 Tax=marine metagenome TaxID=408172 RepID=A0A381WQ21_9ZZZZ
MDLSNLNSDDHSPVSMASCTVVLARTAVDEMTRSGI